MPLVLDSSGKSSKPSISVSDISRMGGEDLIDQQLFAAKEILAEVFNITFDEAGEMIKQRSQERTLWPEKFGEDGP